MSGNDRLNDKILIFIDELMRNQNFMASQNTTNLVEFQDYYYLLKPIDDLFLKNPKINKKTCFELLFEQSRLKEYINQMILKEKLSPGMILAFGTADYSKMIVVGNQQEVSNINGQLVPSIEKMMNNSIFDLSSITKVIFSILIMILIDNKIFSLNDKIGDLDKRFINLKDVTIKELLSFQIPLITDKRLEECIDAKEAEMILFNVKINNNDVKKIYSDIGAMVLKYIVEKICNKDLFMLCKEYIFDKCQMNDTCVEIKEENLFRTVSNNFERRIINDNFILIDDIFKGIVNDGKARLLNKKNKQMHGHTGIFSTVLDMISFCQKFINGELLPIDKCYEIGINRTGRKEDDYKQYLGYLCYSKHPNSYISEVNHLLSGNAIGAGGYTGNQLTIDIKNKIFVFMAANRCHNRVTMITPLNNLYLKDIDDLKYVEWADGKRYFYTQDFAYRRDKIIDEGVKLALQCRYVETLFNG